MSKEMLKQLNRKIRSLRPKFPTDEVCQVFRDSGLLEIGFLSRCCKNDLNGSCMMCDYGCAADIKPQEKYLGEMKYILDSADAPIECLLLCTNGSFFDDAQIPMPLFKAILALASQYDIPTIEFETHYLDVSSEKLSIIQEILPEKHIMIEMGLESVDPLYQENVLMKSIDLPAYEKTIQTIQQCGFEVETNIMIGLPFLNTGEQMRAAFDAVMWSFAHQCRVVLFPINIKPYTVLMQMYKKKMYTPISHWLLIFLLDSIPVEKLSAVTVAWYGNREETYDGSDSSTVFPSACPHCQEKLMRFYSDFLRDTNCKRRKDLIVHLKAACKCACPAEQIDLLNQLDTESFESRYSSYCEALKSEFINKEDWDV